MTENITPPWTRAECCDCGGEFLATRAEPCVGASARCPECCAWWAGYDKATAERHDTGIVWNPRVLFGDPEKLPDAFHTITADPPWKEHGAGKVKRGANRHYGLMSREDILRTMLRSPAWLPSDDAHLYMWVTNTFLPDGLWLMDALGFTYKTNVVWAKRRFGIGFYFRGQHELCLFGTRGLVQRTQRADLSTLLTSGALSEPGKMADHGRDGSGKVIHSRKPVEFYELVEARSPGPFLEMFARTTRPGWASWGNEVTP